MFILGATYEGHEASLYGRTLRAAEKSGADQEAKELIIEELALAIVACIALGLFGIVLLIATCACGRTSRARAAIDAAWSPPKFDTARNFESRAGAIEYSFRPGLNNDYNKLSFSARAIDQSKLSDDRRVNGSSPDDRQPVLQQAVAPGNGEAQA